MKIKDTRHYVGMRVRLKNITDPNDADMNGKTGTLTLPFEHIPFGNVGVRLDVENGKRLNCNILMGEFEEIGD